MSPDNNSHVHVVPHATCCLIRCKVALHTMLHQNHPYVDVENTKGHTVHVKVMSRNMEANDVSMCT